MQNTTCARHRVNFNTVLASAERTAKMNGPKFEANWLIIGKLWLNVRTASKSISEAISNLRCFF